MAIPKISIITPSYNQGEFIEETILSVIGQNYPNLEYIIIDGGSTDRTVEVIKKYEKYLTYWVSEKDKGQSHAINKGFDRATGDILGWLNSDDLYLPGTFSSISELMKENTMGIFFGNCIRFNETENGVISSGSNVCGWQKYNDLSFSDYIIQPSTFWSRKTLQTIGPLREDLHFGFDWEWFLRAQQLNVPFISTNKCFSMYRFHQSHKSGTGGAKRQKELLEIYELYNARAASLYKKLIDESLSLNSRKVKMLIKLMQFFKKSHSYADILKLSKSKKYADFSVKEITETNYMI